MNLKDLFVSHKQVEPVSFIKDTPELPKNIYFNLDRAQKVANPEDTDEEDTSSWSVDENPSYKWTVGYRTKDVIVPKEDKVDDVQVPYRADYKPEKPTKNLLQYLKDKEKFVSHVYRDSGGVETIGYGFTNPEIIKRGKLTEQEASDLLVKDIADRQRQLAQQIKTWDKLNQNQKDALTSYGFNVGVGNWSKTQPRLLAALNEERFKDAAKYMDAVTDRSGTRLPGLVKRRQEEQEWFNS